MHSDDSFLGSFSFFQSILFFCEWSFFYGDMFFVILCSDVFLMGMFFIFMGMFF